MNIYYLNHNLNNKYEKTFKNAKKYKTKRLRKKK